MGAPAGPYEAVGVGKRVALVTKRSARQCGRRGARVNQVLLVDADLVFKEAKGLRPARGRSSADASQHRVVVNGRVGRCIEAPLSSLVFWGRTGSDGATKGPEPTLPTGIRHQAAPHLVRSSRPTAEGAVEAGRRAAGVDVVRPRGGACGGDMWRGFPGRGGWGGGAGGLGAWASWSVGVGVESFAPPPESDLPWTIMRRSTALASALALVLALGSPAAPALAQSAGDDQYQDPFAHPQGGGTGKGSGTTSHSPGTTSHSPGTTSHSPGTTSHSPGTPSGTSGSSGSSGSSGTSGTTSSGTTTSSSTTASTPATVTPPTTAPPTTSSASSSASELPRSGGEPGLVAMFGAGLLLTGAGLRARVRVR